MVAVDFSALAARYPGGIPESDRPRAEAAIVDALAAVRAEAGLAQDAVLSDALASLTLRVARREYANPLRRQSETLADYTWRDTGGGDGILTDADREEIGQLIGRGGIQSVPIEQHWSTTDIRRITPVGPEDWCHPWPDGIAP